MKKLKSATLFMWILVFGALVIVLVLTMSGKVKDNEESGETGPSSYEKYQQELKEKFEVIDTTDACAEALEEIYRDDENVYYLPCIKSNNITIKMKDGSEYPLVVALENELITINELYTRGLGIFSEPITEEDEDVTIDTIDDKDAKKIVEE